MCEDKWPSGLSVALMIVISIPRPCGVKTRHLMLLCDHFNT